LFLDVDNHEALGGILATAFEQEWSRFASDYEDEPDFIAQDPFNDLVNEVPADASQEYEDESPAGCWGYRTFFIESPGEARAAIKQFRSACLGWRKRWPYGSALDDVAVTPPAPRRRSPPTARRGSARK